MKQSDLGLKLSTKRTRKREFLEEMQRVVPWSELIALIEPPTIRRVRPVARRWASPRCCAFTFCSSASG
jgi:hypothetical protein